MASRKVLNLLVSTRFVKGGLSIPSITTSSWLRASPVPPPMPGNVKLSTEAIRVCRPEGPRRSGARSLEHPLAPAPRLEDQVAAAGDRSARPEEEVVMDVRRGERSGRRAVAERLPAHPDCVDLVDEDDALAAPLAGKPLRLPREVADDDRVDADEGLSEAGARDRDERGVETGRDRFREHRLAGSGRAEKEQSALPLSSRPLECLARLPERDDPPNLLLGLHLAADVLELDSPLRVTRLEAPDLGDAHQQHRAHEDREVGDEQERDEDDLREHRRVRERRQEPLDMSPIVPHHVPPGSARRP